MKRRQCKKHRKYDQYNCPVCDSSIKQSIKKILPKI